MDDAPLVRVPQSAGGLPDQGHALIDREWPRREQLLERSAADVFHHEVMEVAEPLDLVDRHDVGMIEPGGEPGLAMEPTDEGPIFGQLRPEHLDRHRPPQPEGFGLEHRAHPAPPQQGDDPVALRRGALQCLLQGGERGTLRFVVLVLTHRRAADRAALGGLGQRRVAD